MDEDKLVKLHMCDVFEQVSERVYLLKVAKEFAEGAVISTDVEHCDICRVMLERGPEGVTVE